MDKKELSPAARVLLFLVLPAVVFFILLIVTVYVGNDTKNAGLQRSLGAVLNAKYNDRYTVGESVPVKTPFAFSAAAFEITSKAGAKPYHRAVLVRMTGFSGPVTGVFLYGTDKTAEFAGLAGIANPTENPLHYGITESLVRFWTVKLPDLCGEE